MGMYAFNKNCDKTEDLEKHFQIGSYGGSLALPVCKASKGTGISLYEGGEYTEDDCKVLIQVCKKLLEKPQENDPLDLTRIRVHRFIKFLEESSTIGGFEIY